MAGKKQEKQENEPETSVTEETQDQAPEVETETPIVPDTTEKEAVEGVSHAQQNPEETVRELLSAHANTLRDSSLSKAERVRRVLTELYEQDNSILNSNVFTELRKKLADQLQVSRTLVDRSKKEVLTVKDTDNSDEPLFDDEPAGGGSRPAVTPSTTGPPIGGGAPIGGAIVPSDDTGLPGMEEPEAPFEWDKKKVGTVMKMFLNMPSWGLEEYPRITKEEQKEIGESFLEIFKEYFPTNKKAGNLLFIGASLEQIMRPRIQAVIQYRMMHKSLEEVEKNAKKAIAESREDD